MTRKESTRAYWQQHYQRFKSQRVTQREYCKTNNLGYWSFSKWKREFDNENNSTSLQRLAVTYQPVNKENIEIIFNDNISISVPDHFSEKTLQRIMSVLRDTP